MKNFSKLIFILLLVLGAFSYAFAITNCDDQAMPAFSCPPGYSMVCSSGGGNYHWACGGTRGGAIMEVPPTSVVPSGTAEIYQNNQTDINFRAGETTGVGSLREVEPAVLTLQACQAKCRDKYGGSGSAGFDACMRSCGDGGAAKTTNPLYKGMEGAQTNPLYDGKKTGVSDKEEVVSIERLSSAVVVKKVTVRGWDPAKKEEFLKSIKSFAELKSGQDLENFAKGVLLRDENVDAAIVSEEEVLVSYKMPAKFLGIFNSPLHVQIKVRADGEVMVKYPWFRFLFKKPVSADSIKQTMQTQVKLSGVGDDAELANIDLQNVLQKQSQVLQIISNVSKMLHDTAMSVARNMK